MAWIRSTPGGCRRDAVAQAIEPVRAVLHGWGYRAHDLESMVCTLLLLNRSPLLSDLSSPVLDQMRGRPAIGRHFHGRHLHGVYRALAALGHADPPPTPKYGDGPVAITGTADQWARWVERWHATSTLEAGTRGIYRVVLAKIGRWLTAEHPEITEPCHWTRQTCTAWIAAVDRMAVGDHSQWRAGQRARVGKPLWVHD